MFLDNMSNIKNFIKNREKRVKKSISRSSKSKTMKIRGGWGETNDSVIPKKTELYIK
jgi:hypothetical protein